MQMPVEEFLETIIRNASLRDIVSQHFFRNTPTFFALSYFSLYLDYFYPKGGVGKLAEAVENKLLEFGGSSVEGVLVSQFFDRESTDPAYVQFREEYMQRFGNEPGFASVNSFDAVNTVLNAMKKENTEKLTKETLNKALNFVGVQGAVEIDRYGDANRKTFLSVVRNGRFEVVK